jgi:hypothetical protein
MMPSIAYRRWATTRASALDEIAQAHVAVGSTGPGRRSTTQQVNQAYAVLLAAQFQGFCRDLHTECADYLAGVVTPVALRPVVLGEMKRARQLDRGNAQPSSLGADFGRFGVTFWVALDAYQAENAARRALLEDLNNWRNAIVHQDFDPAVLGGTTLRLQRVRRWRGACHRLARAFDEVMRRHLSTLSGASPW